MSAALTALRQRLLRELDLGWIITNADVDSFAAGNIVSANMLRNSNWATDMFSNLNVVIFRPGAASAADYIRYAGELTTSTGTLAHTGANYADTTKGSEGVELWKYGIRPTREVVESLNRVLEFEFASGMHLLSHGSRLDYGMDLAATDTNWTDVGSPTTSAKTATQSTQIVPFGPRAYQLVGDAVNEGTRSAAIVTGQGREVSAYAIVAADVGTASFQLYDSTNSATTGDAVTHSERAPMLVALRNKTLPPTCKAVRLNMLGTTNPSDIYWNQVGLYKHDDLTIQLPGFINEGFMAPKLVQGIPRNQVAADVWDAGSLDFRPLTEGIDYWLVANHYDAEPYKVRVRDESLFDWPLFVEYKRPASDYATFAEDETATVSVPVHNVLPRWKIDVLDTILLNKIPKADWTIFREKAEGELIKALSSRPAKSIAPARPFYRGVSRL